MKLYFPMLEMDDYLFLSKLKPVDVAIGLFTRFYFLFSPRRNQKIRWYEIRTIISWRKRLKNKKIGS
jgi:hypothetical protein